MTGPASAGRGRVCFFSEYLFPLFGVGSIEFAGGIETQQIKQVRGLAARGFDITVVTCDFGQPPRMQVDGITILRSFSLTSRIPVVRFFHPRLTRSIAALNAADAEVYFVSGAGMAPGLTYDVARSRKAGFILLAASDHDVVRSLPALGNPRDRWWHRRAVRGADVLLAQTEFQRESFRREFGAQSEVLPNLVEIPEEPVDPGREGTIVWLGTYKQIKRPEWFLNLARTLPERRFLMVGTIPAPPLTQEHWAAAEAAARECPNLEVRGFINHASLDSVFRNASLLVHTSPVEGFSNVLLEAWSYGIPTVSCVDPDQVITRHGMGCVVTEFPPMLDAVRALMANPDARRAAGARGRVYARDHHSPEIIFEKMSRVLDRAIADVRRRRG